MSKSERMYLKDYKSPAYEVVSLFLDFDLYEEATRVINTMQIKRLRPEPLLLDGENLKFVSCEIDGRVINPKVTASQLILPETPDEFELKITTEINPSTNTALEGLYMSKGLFTTQCEAQGFRRITYFFDRPDVMTTYKVSITADEKKYPVLLSNGDLLSKESVGNGRHRAIWKDPFKKPCYLFALVAGDLGVIEDTFTTRSGKPVKLEIFAPHGKQAQCEHSMNSLKKAMKWDEDAFGREYDLSTFMIVAIEDFNMGAMENKGLNIFNSSLVFADIRSASDTDFLRIESVVGHEYFHNWTGNRITCRDWFHLSLKEGLTVYRDQEFSSDMNDRSVQRIQDVDSLRSQQFSEDAGPNAHPVRPDFGESMDNFYTATIYEKGAEVIRMMKNLVGAKGFRKGMDLYFERHDGQAVTIEEFVQAISDANKVNLTHFKQWYHQPGTPQVVVSEEYDASNKTYILELTQKHLSTQNHPEKKPLHIPLIFGLIDSKGQAIRFENNDVTVNSDGDTLFELKNETQKFTFKGMSEKPVLSLNRQFSAPVVLKWRRQADEWIHVMKYDHDGFNRREAVYELLFQYFDGRVLEGKMDVDPKLIEAYRHLIHDPSISPSLKAELFNFPSDSLLAQRYDVLDPNVLRSSRDGLIQQIARELRSDWQSLYQSLEDTGELSAEAFGLRKLQRAALYFWSQTEDPQAHSHVSEWALAANNMSQRLFGLQVLCHENTSFKSEALEKFRHDWAQDSLVMNKWFAVQAASTHPTTFDSVKKLAVHPLFDIRNPNKVYSLIRTFGQNIFNFYDMEQRPYGWYAEQITTIDKINPQVAARLCTAFNFVPKLTPELRDDVRSALEPLKVRDLSKNVSELLSRI